jgi:lipopolysaccharide export LptBFGC system permease protein LptF
MRRADNYILDEIIPPFLLGTASVLMMLVGNTLYAFLDTMLKNNWPLNFVFRVLVFNIPVVLVQTLPVAVALAASLSVNRMARDNEITAMRGVGLSLKRIFAPVMLFSFTCALMGVFLSEKIVPWAFKEQTNWQQYLYNLPTDPIKTGIAMDTQDFTVIPTTLQRLPEGDIHIGLRNTFLIGKFPAQGEFPEVRRIQNMEYLDGKWQLTGIRSYQWGTKGELIQHGQSIGGRLEERLPQDSQGFMSGIAEDVRLRQMSFQDLTNERKTALQFRGNDRARLLDVTRWFKLTFPLMAIPFGLCGVALALRYSRSGAFTGVLLSMGIVVAGAAAYFGLQAVAMSMSKIPVLPAALAAPLLFTIFGAILLQKQE